jgi:hypothetical protein
LADLVGQFPELGNAAGAFALSDWIEALRNHSPRDSGLLPRVGKGNAASTA